MFGSDHKNDAALNNATNATQDTGGSSFNPALPPPDHSFAPAADTINPTPSEDTNNNDPISPPPVDNSSSVISDNPTPPPPLDDVIPSNTTISPPADTGSDDLLDIKQQALTQLSPLISHLDQDPEDKFKTLMMMIQASDNQSLVKDAYDTAQSITDEKAKAQALLDVVNEINSDILTVL